MVPMKIVVESGGMAIDQVGTLNKVYTILLVSVLSITQTYTVANVNTTLYNKSSYRLEIKVTSCGATNPVTTIIEKGLMQNFTGCFDAVTVQVLGTNPTQKLTLASNTTGQPIIYTITTQNDELGIPTPVITLGLDK